MTDTVQPLPAASYPFFTGVGPRIPACGGAPPARGRWSLDAEAEARASGLHLELSRQPFVYRTIQAHTLLRAARARGSQHALAGALMKAFFHDRRNISDLETLGEIAADHGFTSEEARTLVQDEAQLKATAAEIAQTRAAGVTSVPTFDIGGVAMVGGRTEDDIAHAIEQATPRQPTRASA
jgi:predicted DsbA family dithiol-disulfide isomerase